MSDAHWALTILLSIDKGAQDGKVTAPVGMIPWRSRAGPGGPACHSRCYPGAGEYLPESLKTVCAEGSCGGLWNHCSEWHHCTHSHLTPKLVRFTPRTNPFLQLSAALASRPFIQVYSCCLLPRRKSSLMFLGLTSAPTLLTPCDRCWLTRRSGSHTGTPRGQSSRGQLHGSISKWWTEGWVDGSLHGCVGAWVSGWMDG